MSSGKSTKLVAKTLNGNIEYDRSPDGGWGWVVLAASFLVQGICYGYAKSLGYFFKYFQDEFHTSNYETSWILSITFGMFGLGAPFATPIQNKFGARKVIMISGILSLIGSLITSIGLGHCWAFVTVISQMGLYFDKYRSLAIGMASAGSSVCSTVFPYLNYLLYSSFGWRGAMLIYAGIGLNITMLGSLIRPMTVVKKSENTNLSGRQNDSKLKSTCKNFSINKFFQKYWVLMLMGVPEMIIGLAAYVPIVFIVPYAVKELNQTDAQAAQILSMASLVDIFARPLGGFLLSFFKILERNVLLYLSFSVLVLASLQIIPLLFPSYGALMLYALCYGAVFGFIIPAVLSTVPLLLGVNHIQKFLAIKFFVSGISSLIGPPIAGYLIDITGTYKTSYLYCMVFFALYSICYFTMHFIIKRRGGVITAQCQKHCEPINENEVL